MLSTASSVASSASSAGSCTRSGGRRPSFGSFKPAGQPIAQPPTGFEVDRARTVRRRCGPCRRRCPRRRSAPNKSMPTKQDRKHPGRHREHAPDEDLSDAESSGRTTAARPRCRPTRRATSNSQQLPIGDQLAHHPGQRRQTPRPRGRTSDTPSSRSAASTDAAEHPQTEALNRMCLRSLTSCRKP